jgi:hypothetical protein
MERTELTRRIALTLLVALVGLSPVAASAGGTLTILKPIDYDADAVVRQAIRDECGVQTNLPDFVASFAQPNFSDIQFSDKLTSSSPGRALFITVTNITETGNSFTGKQKSMTIKGELREKGKVIGSFRGSRNTMGGFMGGYKGHCAFVGRCAKALAKDVAAWLNNPGMNDTLN